ncbi:hypothetical protein BU24DRAFT_217625 [Aaosphaeria arxii CBS 175.79]|uniref:Zn(2)-C6 fungal-type domain-containing protein n=1 Tax=Aaosphaeria arxii CBS 175.79 TaxID=1450172 RepID=A0A6A5XNX8_9PLEO|nr:uncharacterized protein BU24DRAFT_217625 [Aaosphaeria arxii CBS 175.79]KAF2014609.1 hypothetical protein BU24DRAFT_217625 [Aaosphaeria arxii CBS 175.79]
MLPPRSTELPGRKKAWKPKTKTGCITCRSRRIKCDEEKPHCKRCTSTGRRCDGYGALTLTAQTQQIIISPTNTSLASAMNGLQLNSAQEQEAFHFYQYRSVGEISGLYDKQFWEVQVLQAAQASAAVRHAVISLASLHRKFITGRMPVVPDDTSDKYLRFAWQQSNSAIRELLQSPTQTTIADKIHLMTCCLLFHCIACIQGHQSTAFDHLRSGLKFMREVDQEIAAGCPVSQQNLAALRSLRYIFVDMDTQARTILNEKGQLEWEPFPKCDLAVSPEPFKDFQDARFYFEATYAELQRVSIEVAQTPLQEAEQVEKILQTLSDTRTQYQRGTVLLNEFLQKVPRVTRQDEEAVISILLLHKYYGIIMWTRPRFDGTQVIADVDVDEEAPELEELLDLASQLIHAPSTHTLAPESLPEDYYPSTQAHERSKSAKPALTNPVFSSGTRVLCALWMISCRAGDMELRRKAIAMMLDCPRREGVWDSVIAGRIAWETMRFEETATNGNYQEILDRTPSPHGAETPPIDKTNRISVINIEYVGARVARVEFRSNKHCKQGEKGVFRYMSW